jgi:4-aminobutyrate aminotransferase-like enzyme
MRSRLEQIAAKHPAIGEVRGLGPMLAFELAEQAPEQAAAIVAAAFERGLLLLACGMYGNVIRLLAPLTIETDVLDEGLSVLEDALAVAL